MTERRWVHCPCGKRLLRVYPNEFEWGLVIEAPCQRCGVTQVVRLKRDGTLTVGAVSDTIIQTEEAG